MDLLRRVLSHLPIDNLLKMTRLSKSASFRRVWRDVYSIRGSNSFSIEIEALHHGDLPEYYYVYKFMTSRAAFLQDAGKFERLISQDCEFDFWYCLSIDNRKIQEIAIAAVRKSARIREILLSLNDPGNFPWTPWLDEQIGELLERAKLWYPPYQIYGAIGRTIDSGENYLKYLKFLILRTLGGEDSELPVEIVETALKNRPRNIPLKIVNFTAIIFGYLPEAERITSMTEYEASAFYRMAIINFSYAGLRRFSEQLRMIMNFQRQSLDYAIVRDQILTKRVVLQARACLDDPITRSLLPDHILKVYRNVALEADSTCAHAEIPLVTGNPTPLPRLAGITRRGNGNSIQGSQMLNPTWVLVHGDEDHKERAYQVARTRGMILV